ncbi:hypothetical protein PSHT_14769 [Puccinia striiformis]|uniref:MULE transposase domain-containing protein n=1 Tax=Puccinia striiformis TaxID=27350 RepID=A0A2S4UIP8_9BASI|nr:hypothetical protein PSHT_14769 [Puccinia striiformis]
MSTNNTQAPPNGVFVPPEVWNQMQSMIAMFQVPKTTPTPPAVLSDPLGQTTPLMAAASDPFGHPDASSATALDPPSPLPDLRSPNSEDEPDNKEDNDDDDNHVSLSANKPDLEQDRVVAKVSPMIDFNGTPTLITDLSSFDYSSGEPLDPPPMCQFVSMSDLVAFCQKWARHHRFAVSKSHSVSGKNVYIRCDRYGQYRGSEKVTNKTWTMQIRDGHHNHEASIGPSAHAGHRALIPEQLEDIRRLWKSNLKPTQMLIQLRTSDPNTLATNRTISNAIQKFKRVDLAGRTPIEAMLCILKETNWSSEVKVNTAGKIQNLFFAHPGSIHLARLYHHVALLDATYKTNQYQIPLLHIIGQTATNRSFSIGFCFLTYEDDENYLWAVQCLKKLIWHHDRVPQVFITDREAALRNALHEVFPTSQANLCTWHLNKNITTNCKKHFGPGKSDANWQAFISTWRKVTQSKTPEIYNERYANLKAHLATRPAVLEYLEKNILPVKELFVVAWACQYPHLRNLDTSRVESGHAYLKTFIKNSTGDLLTLFESLSLAVDNQLMSVHESIGKDTMKMLVNLPKPLIPLLGKISSFAIKECKKQYERLLGDFDPTEPCSKTLTTGIGIPCAHKIAELMERDDGLSPDDFHLQWHLKYNPEATITDEEEIDLDEEIKKLSISLSHENPSDLAKIFEQIHQIAAGTHTAVPIQALEVKKNPKGRPNNKKKLDELSKKKGEGSTSTKRNPSAFEAVEADLEKEGELIEAELKKTTNKREANTKPDRRSKRSKIVNQNYAEDSEASNNDRKSDSLPGLADINRLAAGRPKSDEAGSEASYGEAIDNDALLALLDPKIKNAPIHLRYLISSIYNPPGDGNCGFRCVSKALGYDHSNNGLWRVREEMMVEITKNRATYSRLQGGEREIKKIENAIQVPEDAKNSSTVPPEKWLDKLSHGQILANTYARPVIFLSIASCTTFLPTRAPPPPESTPQPMYLLHVDGNHWVLPDVEAIDGVKPIPPPISSKKSTSKAVKAWLSYIQEGLALYNKGLVAATSQEKK